MLLITLAAHIAISFALEEATGITHSRARCELTAEGHDPAAALLAALESGHVEDVDNLLGAIKDAGKLRELLDTKQEDGSTVLHVAASKGYAQVVEKLLSSIQDPDMLKKFLHQRMTFGFGNKLALHVAVSKGHAEVVEKMLSMISDADERLKLSQMTLGWGIDKSRTALHLAVGKPEVVEKLLGALQDDGQRQKLLAMKQYPSDHICIKGNLTALHWAVQYGDADVVKKMLDAIQDPDKLHKVLQVKTNNGETALHIAASKENVEVVEDLLVASQRTGQLQELLQTKYAEAPRNASYEDQVHWSQDTYHWREIRIAAWQGNAEVVKKSLGKLHNPGKLRQLLYLSGTLHHELGIAAMMSSTPLHVAASKGHAEVIEKFAEFVEKFARHPGRGLSE